ncbi:hypothetical protein AJ80_00671 [Polytolypa hystricis UAMH7299]|uniref:PPM-type phosphatase domain-containing protein n=1 Tax=Polytolypa hystricis (strain UAMH7299) TaxID=1447883 RepID=A0A2B7Z4A2_POLH7|nr:hypothetical protein AJ80_00671 [Polytolypa hystricis UAMH7299]
MFGSSGSPPKDKLDSILSSGPTSPSLSISTEDAVIGREKKSTPISRSPASLTDERSPSTGKKRRSSSVAKAASFFASARNSLHLSSTRESSKESQSAQTPMQKLGKSDPALAVPQGSLNNSAGESVPTQHSSFRVGVTEDRNRKCRRTMEDTHAYLYNFLGTPSPLAKVESAATSKQSQESISGSTESSDSTHVIETDNGYFAIFDGHAGTFAAEWCGKKLHLILEEVMKKNPNTPVPELLDLAFTSVDQHFEKLPVKNSGCTAVAAVLRWEDRVTAAPLAVTSNSSSAQATDTKGATEKENTEPSKNKLSEPTCSVPPFSKPTETTTSRHRVLYTANVGDARIVLCRNGKALRLSYDHKGSDENEGKRIMNAGGLILNNRVNGVLAVTRALGDSYMKELVTGHPYTTETVIQPSADEFLILACDGLWDVCSDQEAVDLIRETEDPQAASKILVDHALSRFSTDNLSCMIVRFDSKAIQNTIDHITTPVGVQGDPLAIRKGGINETDKIVADVKKYVVPAVSGEECPTPPEGAVAIVLDGEPGPEVATPDVTKDLREVADLNVLKQSGKAEKVMKEGIEKKELTA